MNDKLQEYLKCEKLEIDPSGMFQEQIKNYILENADEVLTNKILANTKNISDCFRYVYEEIKKEYIEANGKVSGGCAVEPQKVFGLAVHYFDEVEIPKMEEPKEPTVPRAKTQDQLDKEIKEYHETVEDKPKPIQANEKKSQEPVEQKPKMTKKEKELEQAFGGFTLFG